MGKVVGIDLGTTNSVVAVMEGGKPVVIANAEGMRTTPSVVAFTKEGERLVGQLARRQSVLNPQNTFFGVKRYIGRKYIELSPESKRVPYTIRKTEMGNIEIKSPRAQKNFAPEEISAMVLKKLADEATRYLGQAVTGAVITVPAYFNDSQRQATRDAGRIAGLDVLRILNEPTAAALAYGFDRVDNQTILVFDLGGGTFDVSILDVGDGVFEVRATSGDTQLGGNDFDRRIVDWLAEDFLAREGIDLRTSDRQALQRLMEAAEKAKIELSSAGSTEINLPFITATPEGPKHIETRLTRSQFEELSLDLVGRLRGPVRQALNDAGLSASRIDEVIMVGGASRMPMVKELVRSMLDREPTETVNPDEVVAVGAAIQAGILTREVQDILLLDVTPLSLGLETIGGVMKKLIPRNTTIPVRRSDTFSTSENNQTMVEVHIVQGEREMSSDNKSLGRFKLMGIPPAPRGIPQVQVSFDIDANGILQVTALDKTTGREQGLTIQGASTLSESEVERMIQEAERFADQDRQKRDRIDKRTKAEALTYEAERQLREVALDFGMQFASQYRRRIENLVQELRDVLKQDDDRGIDVTQADLRDAIYDLQREVYQLTREDEEDTDFFGSIRRTLSNLGEDFFGDDDYYEEDRRGYDRDAYGRDIYGRDGRDSFGSYGRNSYDRPGYERQDYGRQDYGRQDYGRQDYRRSDYDRPDSEQQDYGRQDYGRQDYSRPSAEPSAGGLGSGQESNSTDRDYDRSDYSRQDYDDRSADRPDYGRPGTGRPDYSRQDYDDRPADRPAERPDPERLGRPDALGEDATRRRDAYSPREDTRSDRSSYDRRDRGNSGREDSDRNDYGRSDFGRGGYSQGGRNADRGLDDYSRSERDSYSADRRSDRDTRQSNGDSPPRRRIERRSERSPAERAEYNKQPPSNSFDDEWGDDDEWL